MSTEEKILKLYDEADKRMKSPEGHGRRIHVKIGDIEIETESIAPPPAARSYQQPKAVSLDDLKKALRGMEALVSIQEQASEIWVIPLKHLGVDWEPIDKEIKKLNGGVRAWKTDQANSLNSKWILKKG